MCYDEENRERPIGVNEAENAWLEQMSKFRAAANNDVFTNGGLLDNTTKFGYCQPVPYGTTSLGKQILETEFTYGELDFISRCRLMNMTISDMDKLMGLLHRYRSKLASLEPTPPNPLVTMGYAYPQSQPAFGYNQVQAPRFQNNWANNAWFTGSSTSITETIEKPRRGRKPKKTDDVETGEIIADTKAETEIETETEKKTGMDSLFAKINNDSI